MLNTIDRTPKVPRKIRAIRPKRQLARDRESGSKQRDDKDNDWLSQAENADEVAHFRGGTAVHRLNRTQNIVPSTNATANTSDTLIQEVCDGKPRDGILHTVIQLHGKIRQFRKKLFWGAIVIISWRTIYLMDLEQYTNYTTAKEEQKTTQKINYVPLEVKMKSIEDEISSLNEITDDMLTSTLSKSSNIRDSENSVLLVKSGGVNSMSRTQLLPQHTSGHIAEPVKFPRDEFVGSNQEDTSLLAALSHFSSPLHGKDTTRFPNGMKSQNHMSNYLNDPISTPSHGSTAGLDCSMYGGPFRESESADLVYWRDIPTDASFKSPFYNAQAQESTTDSIWNTKYLTFEMDDAGWNNMRIGFENMLVLAHAMGRTLVIPPRRQITHGVQPDIRVGNAMSFGDFYDIEAIGARQKGLNIITMEQFLQREALNGKLQSNITGDILYPPNDQVKWDNQHLQPLWAYIRNVTKIFQWSPLHGVLVFPSSGSDEQHIYSMMDDVLVEKDGRAFPHFSEYQGRPVSVNAPPIERFREILAGRRKVFVYSKKLHDEYPVVHFKADQVDGTRLIVPFYAFLWFEDWRHDLWSKRFIRDNLRYKTEIICLAARIISAIRDRARRKAQGNMNGLYDAIHIRRGDFQQQFPSNTMNSSDILTGLKEYVTPGSTVFVATNERNRSYFTSIGEVYDIIFLEDFSDLLISINDNYFPLIEQIVASRGRVFVGTFFSTFSAYITRLRGYYSVKEMHDGHLTGGLRNTYYLPAKWKNEMRLYQAVHNPLFGREFPVAWRDIDRLELPRNINN